MSLFTSADVAAFRSERLLAAAPERADLSDAALLDRLRTAEKEVGRKLRVQLEPTEIIGNDATPAEIAALNGAPYIQEPGYDYDPSFFQGERWGAIQLRHKPVLAVHEIVFVYPSPFTARYTVPSGWIRVDRRAGRINLVPTGGYFGLPLAPYVMQVLGGGRSIPFMIQVRYRTGLADVRGDWPDILDVIYKSAALSILEDAFAPQSGSISGDGLSQSLSVDMAKHREVVDLKLFGKDGSNGGLRAAIHGIPMMVL